MEMIKMAVDVTIKNNGIFKKKLQLKDLLEDNMRYGIMDEAFRLEEKEVGENTVIFNSKSICRGYEISFSKGNINLKMPLPTSDDDIIFFYQYIKRICKKLNTKTFIRNDFKTSLDEIDTYIRLDIDTSKKALEMIEKEIDEGKYENMYIFGAVNPVSIGRKEIKEIAGDTKKFGNMMNKLQKMDVYYAKANVYKRKNNTYFGVYMITEKIPSVLPYVPELLVNKYDLKINDWNIGFVIDDNVEGFISYEDFIELVDEDSNYDAEHFIITLDSNKIKELLDNKRIDL